MRAYTKDRIRQIAERAIADGTTAGLNILVKKDGEELFYGEYGYANVERKETIRRDTIFRLYSMSKPITAVAAMILMEQGSLDLAQQVKEILPGFDRLTVEKNGKITAAERPMTVLNLLNMTSGFTYGDDVTAGGRETCAYLAECEQRMFTEQAVTTLEFAEHMGHIPLAFEPDSSWCYSLSADILGAVIEAASGMRFGEFLEQEIFRPLGMKDTAFWVPEEKQIRLASAYEQRSDGIVRSSSHNCGQDAKPKMRLYTGNYLVISNQMKMPPAFESGGAGLVSTIDDYARLAQMLLNGGELDGVRILKPQTVKFLCSGDLTPPQKIKMREWEGLTGFTYNHLLRRMIEPGMAGGLAQMDEYGWDGWLGCYFANFPKENVSMLLMQQRKDSGTIPMTRKIRNVILTDEELFPIS